MEVCAERRRQVTVNHPHKKHRRFDSYRLHQIISRWTSGLGHHPFKVTRRVRFPYAIPICRCSPLGRAPDCLSDLGGFDSRRRRHIAVSQERSQSHKLGSDGSNPSTATNQEGRPAELQTPCSVLNDKVLRPLTEIAKSS